MPKRKTPASTGGLKKRWNRIRRHTRLAFSAVTFAILSLALIVLDVRPALAVLVAFDIAALVFLSSTLYMVMHATTTSIRQRARNEDEGYWAFLLNGAAIALIALVALGMELHASKYGGVIDIVLAAVTLLLSWLFLNTMFALHYAHQFYGDSGGKESGLEFPGTKQPDYWDFLYFSFVLGMTFQVSDVEISDRGVRRVALAHSVIAFFFNVIIIALSVNVVASSA